MDVVLVIAEFKNRLKSLGYAESTIEGYRKNLDLFRRHLEERHIRDLRKVNARVILDYREKVMNEQNAMETKALKIRPHHAQNNPKERTLFLNHSGLPVRPESVRQAIRGYRIRAGIKKTVSPHAFRRTCATHLLQQGADIRYIQKLLGHKSLRTTQTYTKVMPVDVKKTHDKTHPNSRGRGSGGGRKDED